MKNVLFVALFLLAKAVYPEQLYQKPEAFISDLIRAESFSKMSLNYQGTAAFKTYTQYTPGIEYVSRSQLKLAGLRFNPKNYTGIANSYVTKLVYFDLKKKIDHEIKFEKNSIIGKTSWSNDGKNFLVGVETPTCYQLWTISVLTLTKKQIPNTCINEVMGNNFYWINNNEILISKRTTDQFKELTVEKTAPQGPVIMESLGKVAQNRTFQDLLKNQQNEVVLEKAIKAQFVVYNLKNSTFRKLGGEASYSGITSSPDRKYFLVSKILKPYSYVVPIGYFAKQFEIWDANGNVTHTLHKGGPYENIPIEGTITGPRSLSWLPDEPATLFYVQALDGGDWNNKVEYRDEIFKLQLLPNKKTKAESFYKTKNRFSGLSVLDRNLGYLLSEYERDTDWLTCKHIKLENNKVIYDKLIFSLNQNDSYNDPGSTYKILNKYHRSVVAVDSDNESIFLSGEGATPDGYKPFLNKLNLVTSTKKEIFRSADKTYERFLDFLDDKKLDQFLTSYETNSVSPRYNLNSLTVSGVKTELLYADKNPFEIMSKLKKEVIKYKRNDGVELSGTLYYPLDYKEGQKYPLVIDAYPLEYTDAKTAGQVRSSAFRFEVPFRADVLYFALRGYAVLQDAQIPIIGHPETKNDTFLPQLMAGAEAAIQAVNSKGIIEPKKVGVIGHSYGAFMVANLLTHSNLFAAGIARSGAYNRTLTPFGFQGERRTFWQAKETYLKLSPFYSAEKMNKPLLLIHGQVDNNAGTYTMQSEGYYEALKGQGANVKLVLLPDESHSYAAIESIEHVLYESFKWFDKYLKDR